MDSHKIPSPEGSTHPEVVPRESSRIAFTHAALNVLDVFSGDIMSVCLQDPTSEKHFIMFGSKFGVEHVGKRALFVRAIYGGKIAGRDFRNYLRSCMSFLDFKP